MADPEEASRRRPDASQPPSSQQVHRKHDRWRRNQFESVGGGTDPARSAANYSFWSCRPLFLALKVQLVVLVSAFVMVTTVWSVFAALLLTVPPCPAICKNGGAPAPRALWSRHHCIWPGNYGIVGQWVEVVWLNNARECRCSDYPSLFSMHHCIALFSSTRTHQSRYRVDEITMATVGIGFCVQLVAQTTKRPNARNRIRCILALKCDIWWQYF